MRDLTDVAPTRRMSVARGRLEGIGSGGASGADLGHAEAAAERAVKHAADLPGVAPFLATHVETLVTPEEDGLTVTVTVQAYARCDLDTPALAGVAAALLSLRHALGVPGARLVDLHLVQNVA